MNRLVFIILIPCARQVVTVHYRLGCEKKSSVGGDMSQGTYCNKTEIGAVISDFFQSNLCNNIMRVVH